MVRKAMRSLVALAVLPALPATTSAQVQSWQEVQVGDIETIKGKRIALAGVFGEPDFDWRPMDGVHSVREVLGLAITGPTSFRVRGALGQGRVLHRASPRSSSEPRRSPKPTSSPLSRPRSITC